MRARIAAILALILLPLVGCQGAGPRLSAFVPAAARVPAASGYSVIYSFTGGSRGELPEANPILDSQGRLYGVTMRGGLNGCSTGCGTIFQLSHSAKGWNETTLWSFDVTHGAYPMHALVADAAGNLYGATDVGGSLGVAYGLFDVAHERRFRVLHNFQGDRDGGGPRSNLIFDAHGDLYGTTVAGGSGGSGGGGTVYELIPSGNKWKEKILYRFTAYGSNGANPQAGVIFGRDGSLYGTTSYGGNTACPTGCGVVYRLKPTGNGHWIESVLHAFDGADGHTPVASLVADAAGNLYGSADEGGQGGCPAGCGTLFELKPKAHDHWSFAVIHSFNVQSGGGPAGNMAFDGSGNLYGTTVVGGNVSACPSTAGCGVVFKLTPETRGRWHYTVLHIFNNAPDGALPGGLTMSAGGTLYGTTVVGGTTSLGTVFEIARPRTVSAYVTRFFSGRPPAG